MRKGYFLFYMMIVLFLLGVTGLVLRSVLYSKQAMINDFIEQDKKIIMEWTTVNSPIQ